MEVYEGAGVRTQDLGIKSPPTESAPNRTEPNGGMIRRLFGPLNRTDPHPAAGKSPQKSPTPQSAPNRKRAEADRRYYQKHRERILAQQAEYRARCPSRSTPARRSWVRFLYSLDRERILRQKKRYYRKNRERIRARQAEYRAAHPFKNSPAHRAYMRVYMREWGKRPCS